MKDCCDNKTQHPDHAAELKSLNRVAGQVEGVKKMIDERRYCPDILTQLRAARAAIKTIETQILNRHLSHCVSQAMQSKNKKDIAAKIAELTDIFKRLS